ncbi:MAG: 4-oxalocrotonate tautomerase family protein [Myxococcales bacterium]
MPFVDVRLSGNPSSEMSQRVATTLTSLAASVLHKNPAVVAVAVQPVAASHWFVGARSLDAQAKASFFVDIRITDETNTKDEKAAFVAAVFKDLGGILGEVHEVSYVHVHDARAGAYGYGGLTQEERSVRGRR